MTICPVNGHLLIEPLAHESFIASQRETFEEIGVVIALDDMLKPENYPPVWDGEALRKPPVVVSVGDKVYFDSWLAVRYPKNDKEFYWLVKWEHVRAIEHVEPEVSK